MDCRFIKNLFLFNILDRRLKEQLEILNQGVDEPYTTNFGFPFEISEKEIHEVKIYSLLSQSASSQYYLLTIVTFPKNIELDEILDILSNENSESKFEISESKLISCANELLNSRYLLTGSITERLPKFFKYQLNDRIFNVVPSNCKLHHCYTCFEQRREERVEYIYFETTNCVIQQELLLYTVKTDITQETPIREEKKEGFCKEFLKRLSEFWTLYKMNLYSKLD